MSTDRTFLFSGGGSGGHLFPGLAVAEELVARDPTCRIRFAGSGRDIERTVLAGTGFRHVPLPVLPPAAARKHPVRFAAGFAASIRAAFRLLDELRPEAVIGLGGFASVPVGIAARARRVPLILLEQNVVPGRATTWLSRWADRVCVSFEETRALLPRHVRSVVTGNPVRAEVRRVACLRPIGRRHGVANMPTPSAKACHPQVWTSRSSTSLPGCRPRILPAAPCGGDTPPATHFEEPGSTRDEFCNRTMLVLGGSQGARGVNAMGVAALTGLKDRLGGWQIVHQTGERDVESVCAAYAAGRLDVEVAAFFTDLPARYAAATLAVSRAGATTLAELACVGCPAILVPYPGAVREHQRRNAERYAVAEGAVVVAEGADGAGRLGRVLGGLLDDSDRCSAMSRAMLRLAMPDAAGAVADVLIRSQAIARAAA